jgi:type IV secretory pathway VirB2 component (pilin)
MRSPIWLFWACFAPCFWRNPSPLWRRWSSPRPRRSPRVLASFRGTLATAFFGIAFVVTGFLAAFNRISWAWVALVVVGAFLVFAGPAIVANLRSSFS